MSESMPNFWWCPTHHLYRGGEERPCPDAEKLVCLRCTPDRELRAELEQRAVRKAAKGLNGCYCCSCTGSPDGFFLAWDAACHLHGAHGKRGCVKHDVDPINCDCGCDYRVFS